MLGTRINTQQMAAVDSMDRCKATCERVIFSNLGFNFVSKSIFSRLQTA